MIYLITGIPGSGKTLYAVSTLIQSLMADKFTDSTGTVIERRLLIDGIPSLTLPHELMAQTTVTDKVITVEDGFGFGNWWEWCKPGDVLVIDEVQRICRPRAFGSKPPQMVTELETHRHKGVDFILITQSPMLMDQNVRRLVGRHQHVRRLFGMQRALIYDWDGCQADVTRVQAATKTLWSYPKHAYKMYASSELHTKQKQQLPMWLAVPVLAIIAGVAVGPQAYASLSGSMTGKGLPKAQTVATVPAPVVPPVQPASAPQPAAPVAPYSPYMPPVAHVQPPQIAGCVYAASVCKCYTKNLDLVEPDLDRCNSLMTAKNIDVQPVDQPGRNIHAGVMPFDDNHDGSALASMSSHKIPLDKMRNAFITEIN